MGDHQATGLTSALFLLSHFHTGGRMCLTVPVIQILATHSPEVAAPKTRRNRSSPGQEATLSLMSPQLLRSRSPRGPLIPTSPCPRCNLSLRFSRIPDLFQAPRATSVVPGGLINSTLRHTSRKRPHILLTHLTASAFLTPETPPHLFLAAHLKVVGQGEKYKARKIPMQ